VAEWSGGSDLLRDPELILVMLMRMDEKLDEALYVLGGEDEEET
jgi:hypothetical protein